ncbi:hypothetical protein HDU81_003850 [Chytriomyces hyalinus]|nr:hypothetical protein HDU81_003850 [Chytriomyces hyalinus]
MNSETVRPPATTAPPPGIAEAPPEEAPAYESLPRGSRAADSPESVAVDIPSAAPVPVPAETETEPPPPDYDGPIPTGMVVLAVVKLIWEKAPAYFAVERPARLEDKISNVVYTTRMQNLNTQLGEDKIDTELKRMRYIKAGVAVGSAIIAGSTLALYSVTDKNTFIIYAGFFVFVLLLAFLPKSARYVKTIDKACSDWTKEDKAMGTNLVYMAKPTKKADATRIEVSIVIVEPLVFYQSPNPMGNELPQYVPPPP